ncbi:ESCRT-II complex, vps25 subunit [Dissoconium aciculare CBS 342.82]|uniref:ESCRT-II complex subunit VPS25 n=1 Tax=Dissoconium aciculare CBS 342.82 TaxID=1314786 RepID=A0A6J3LYW0_9PEZI|nr:ESCRT-II complex, vps25 subunit [Dissoconium aciculare CBS 342.82]KAF1820960.1 ESCRT-II complex, vps25 subunit [Dissoconium aciculare CBS 342.82]
MSSATPEPSLAGLSLASGNNPGTFTFPRYASFRPFYSIQRNLATREKQFQLWADLITAYCAHHHIFRLDLSSLPPDLFHNPSIDRKLLPGDIRIVLDHLSTPAGGSKIEWISATTRGEVSASCYVYWRTLEDWANALHSWVDATGQKGAVLTIYELREGEAVIGQDWKDMDEGLLRKVLNVLVKRGKAQIFGQEENAGVKFF